MDSLTFRPGKALLQSHSHTLPWKVVFEDEGVAAYFYACDRSLTPDGGGFEPQVVDVMLVYNVSQIKDRERDYLASVQWSRDGRQAVLYLDGSPQAIADFAEHRGYCKSNFPNFMEERGAVWQTGSHAWDESVLSKFETAIYSES